MSRHSDQVERLTRQRDQALEDLSEARAQAAEVRGRLAGERHAAQTVAVQLAERAASAGAEVERLRMGGHRAVTDVRTLRRLVAEHLVSLQAGADPQDAVTALVDQALVRGIALMPEVRAVEADRADRAAKVSAAEAAAAVTAGGDR